MRASDNIYVIKIIMLNNIQWSYRFPMMNILFPCRISDPHRCVLEKNYFTALYDRIRRGPPLVSALL